MKTILIGAGFTGVQLPRGEMSLPNGDTVVKKGDFIGVVTPEDSIGQLLEFTKTPKTDIRRVVLFGADRVGSLLLARRKVKQTPSSWLSLIGLASSAPEVEIVVVDMDADLCRETIERFPDVRVLRGDVADESLMSEEDLFFGLDFIDARRALRHRRMFRLDGGRGQGDPLDRASTASSVTSAGSIPNGAFNAVRS